MATKGLPKYLHLKRELLRKIKSSRPGDRVDSEHELVAKYSVSRATVSKAIGELVSEGYLFREQGRGTFVADVEGRKDGSLGFIYYTWATNISKSSYFGDIFSGVEEAAGKVGRDILFMAGKTAPGEEFQPPSPAELARKGLSGVLAVGIDSDDHLASLMASGLPMVSVDYHSERMDIDAVVGGTESGGYMGTKLLLEKGHRLVAFLGVTRHGSRAYQAPDQGSLERLAGYRRAHQEAGLAVDEDFVLQPLQSEFSFPARLEKLASSGKVPTAVFSSGGGGMLNNVVTWARDRGVRLETVAADCLPIQDPWGEPEFRVCENAPEIGRTAVRLLMERIGGFSGPARTVEVPCQMVRVAEGQVEVIAGNS
jgi:GntR family transcriptional regulator of arabinose operon